jgi:hypothetical protein
MGEVVEMARGAAAHRLQPLPASNTATILTMDRTSGDAWAGLPSDSAPPPYVAPDTDTA